MNRAVMVLRLLIVLLAVGGIVDSTLAYRIHFEDPSQAPPCKVTEQWDCGAVNHSRFAVFPPTTFDEVPGQHTHVPVALFGIIGYALVGVLALSGKLWWLLQASEIGFGFAAMLTYMEAYVLEKWCIYCVWSQTLIAAILLCTIVALILQRRKMTLGLKD